MGLFKRKDKTTEYSTHALLTAFDQMEYFIVTSRSNDELFKLADTVLNGKPVLANFDKVSVSDCNYILAFMSGLVYAKDGEVVKVGERLFLFARREEFLDGSLKEYVEDYKQ